MRSSLRSVVDTVRELGWLRRNLHVRPTDFVLDVGSGGGPNPRSNVLCDQFLADGTERHGSPLVVDRPFIAGDVHRLPFKDGSFDYVILSHVLEHLPEPGLALAELQRVARRGYIETPAAAFEKVYGFPFHRWLVTADGDGLFLRAKTQAIHDPEVRAFFERVQAELGTGARFWSRRRHLGVYTSYEWEGVIRYRVEGEPLGVAGPEPPGFVQSRTDGTGTAEARVRGPRDGGPLWRAQQWYGRRLRRRSDRPWSALWPLLCCPWCHGDLARTDPVTLACGSCQGKYPIDQRGIPLLLRECRQGIQVSVT